MSDYRLLATDLDGTLLNDDKSCDANLINKIQEFVKKGNYFAVITGRSVNATMHVLKDLDLIQPNVFLVSFQGNTLYYPLEKKLIFANQIEPSLILQVMEDLEKAEIYCHAINQDEILTFHSSDELEKYNAISKEKIHFLNQHTDILNFHDIAKVIAINYDDYDKLLRFEGLAKEKYKDSFEVFFSSKTFLEFVKKGTDKGFGLKMLCQHLDIPLEKTIACGDERNDIAMIKTAGLGVAVSNANAEVKSAADYVTLLDNNHSALDEIFINFI